MAGSSSIEERKKQDRFEAECIENRTENNIGGRAQPGGRSCRMEVGLFLAGPPSRGLREQEAGGAWHEVPPTPHSDVWHELTEQAPCSHGDEPRAHESCRHSPAWAPPPPPFAPLRSPEIGLERGSGWPSAPGLGKLPSESDSCTCIVTRHGVLGEGHCITSQGLEGLRISGDLTQHPHAMDGETKTQR